ncbi:MAG TPA: hypothetical protein VG722_00045 [Tepidisphaeraceae bacterium]|nr:hypothetical protein [Tepidisphaeraceae bacterium]
MDLMPVDKSLELRMSDAGESATGGNTANPVSPTEKIHSLLRGRYKLAIGLGVSLAIAFGVLGAIFGHVQYQSLAEVRCNPVVPSVMYQTVDPNKQALPMFNSYVDTQAQLLQSERVLDMAMSSDLWKQTGLGNSPDDIDTVQTNLTITHDSQSYLILIQFLSGRPAAAQAGLQAILNAYKKLYGESDAENTQRRLEILGGLRNNLNADYQAKRQAVRDAAEQVGTMDLDKQYDVEFSEYSKYETTLKDLELQLAMASVASPTTQKSNGADMDADDLAAQDHDLATMIATKQSMQEQVAILREQGYLPNHPKYQAAKAQLDVLTKLINDRVASYNKKLDSGQLAVNTNTSSGAANPLPRLTPSQLKAQIERVRQLFDQANKDLMTLGTERLHMQSLKQDETDAKAKLDAVQNEISEINVESNITGRIEIDPASQPVVFKKSRPIKFATLGVFGGLGIGFGFVMLIGLIDRRFRSPADAKLQNSPMLGILPNLPDDLSDPEQAAITAHYVHQIRTLLQIWDSSRGKQVFSVTSPVSGTGKTSLSLALGVSFAAASKTLLIDCDLVSGGLTYRANAIVKRKIGRILQKEGLLSDRQLEEALRLAHGSRRRLGEILVELGYLKESDLTQALVAQQKADVGLIDAINGENLDECIAETGIANLYVLALGSASAQHISRITPQAIRKLLHECRERFDTILIDSGPVPGSLEASVVAAEVDGVILCVSRGEQRPLAERCVEHLYSLGARVAGVVFNRARTEDMMLDGTTIRSSQPMTSDAGTLRQSARFGPMARAVASAAVQDEEANGKNGNETQESNRKT